MGTSEDGAARAPLRKEARKEPLYAIYDRQTGRPYVQRAWTKDVADRELEELLAHCSENSPWRQRLFVAGYQRGVRQKAPPEGES